MQPNQIYEPLIKKYLQGIASPDEKKEVEKRMLENDEFKAAFQFYSSEYNLLEAIGETRTREQIKKIYASELLKVDHARSIPSLKWILISLLFISLIVFFVRKNFTSTNDAVLSDASLAKDTSSTNSAIITDTVPIPVDTIHPKPKVAVTKADLNQKNKPADLNIQIENTAAIAMAMYELPLEIGELRSASGQNNMQKAWTLLRQGKINDAEKLADSVKSSVALGDWNQIKAHISILKKNYEQAIFYLNSNAKEEMYKDEAQWYLVLVRFASRNAKNQSQARQELEFILQDKDHPFKEIATQLHQNLNK